MFRQFQNASFSLPKIVLTLILLFSLKYLAIIWSINWDLLWSSGGSSVLYFVHQDVFVRQVRPLSYHEDWRKRLNDYAEYQNKISAHVKSMCSNKISKSSSQGTDIVKNFKSLPYSALNNLIIDKKRRFLFGRVLGAFGAKWSTHMVNLNNADKGKDNLIKLSTFLSTTNGVDYLRQKSDLFRFYFVRNPLDRVISGYYYYFEDLKYAKFYLNGTALIELATINKLNLVTLKHITFEQYIRWVVHSDSAVKHFGIQSEIVQPCHVQYNLNGIFEMMHRERSVIMNRVPGLVTNPEEFTTERDLEYLTREAQSLVKSVKNKWVMTEFYSKFQEDYKTWNYSKPEDWRYPFPGVIKTHRHPHVNMTIVNWPRVRDLTEEDVIP